VNFVLSMRRQGSGSGIDDLGLSQDFSEFAKPVGGEEDSFEKKEPLQNGTCSGEDVASSGTTKGIPPRFSTL
jgi:hypothetical protein